MVPVFRELLQNSDDALSSTVKIHFETAAYIRWKEGKQGNIDIPSPLITGLPMYDE
ncbi:hypothetical protein JVT61DRAFT_6143 [Boletus reticuloceps]|uniref:Uncharacterized protein n=1 Tax=Boletus reticuloceps TaxID=495285 RepID=A0A8I3A6W1_9AGAM|nr:hypothetical protein JVT61DRAFT_6143 [Boletus reticuloceps]